MIGKIIPYLIMAAVGACALWRGAPYFTVPLILFMAAWYSIRMLLTDAAGLEVQEERDAKRERPLALVVGIGMVFLPLFALATPLLDFAAYDALMGQYALGAAAALAGLYCFWRAHADLGAFWSAHLELRAGHALITTGIYSKIRHPMYAAIYLITIAQALLLTNWVAGPAGIMTFTVLYWTRVDAEEQMMADRFDKEWQSYAARTPRLVPQILG